MRTAFETLIEADYAPEIAYTRCSDQLTLRPIALNHIIHFTIIYLPAFLDEGI
jgi:hypothetical protein